MHVQLYLIFSLIPDISFVILITFIFFITVDLSICTVPVEAVAITFKLGNESIIDEPKYIFDLLGL